MARPRQTREQRAARVAASRRLRERLALWSCGAAAGTILAHMVLTTTSPREYWWTAIAVVLALPLAAAATARTPLGRWVAAAGALFETPFVLLFGPYGAFVLLPSLALLWAAVFV